jgi:hypothetical protein
VSQQVGSAIKTRVTCANAPSKHAACFTMWRWREADTAAFDAVRYPICGDCRLLLPLNLNLHLPKAHLHVLAHHLTAVPVLFTRATPVIHLRPNNFHHNTGRMKGPGACGTGAGSATTSASAGRDKICHRRGTLLRRLRLPRHRRHQRIRHRRRRGTLLRRVCLPPRRRLRSIRHRCGCAIDCPGLFRHRCGKSSDCRGIAYGRPGECIVRGIISSERTKDFCALWAGSSAHRAVNAPLVDGGACTTFPVGNRGGGGHDVGGGLCGLVVRVWL